jgi:hypothetical protein
MPLVVVQPPIDNASAAARAMPALRVHALPMAFSVVLFIVKFATRIDATSA